MKEYKFKKKWDEMTKDEKLVCMSSCYKNLFKTDPGSLYINWAAALQIQFHVSSLKQDYMGTKEEWCKQFLSIFVRQARARIIKMEKDFVNEFEPLTQ